MVSNRVPPTVQDTQDVVNIQGIAERRLDMQTFGQKLDEIHAPKTRAQRISEKQTRRFNLVLETNQEAEVSQNSLAGLELQSKDESQFGFLD